MKDDAERARAETILAKFGDGMPWTRGPGRDTWLAAIDAMLAFAQQPEGWRPIDTAWQAGSNPVIVTDGLSVHGGAWWHSREEAWLGCDGIVPTHWMPLPAPPAAMLDAAPIPGEE